MDFVLSLFFGVTDFLTAYPLVALGLTMLFLWGVWRLDVRCHPDDHPRYVARRELAEQDRIWKDAK